MGSKSIIEVSRRRTSGKVKSSLNKRLENVKWGKFKLKDLFEIFSSKKIYHANKIDKIYDNHVVDSYPYIVRTTQNNGLRGYIKESKETLNDKNTLSFAQDTFSVFYQKQPYFTGNKVKVLKPKFQNRDEKIMVYLTASFQKSLNNLSWGLGSTVDSIKQTPIQLPTKNNEIDFDFMEKFISEFEVELITELNTYLKAMGLEDYNITDEEQKVLDDFDNMKWGEFRLGDLFERIKTNKLPFKADDLPKEPIDNYVLPCLTSSFQNQGLNYFSPKDNATILKNVISIPSNSDVYRAYFQSREFTVLSDAYAIEWIYNDAKLSPNQYLFTVPCINKVTDLSIYSYKNKLGGWNVVQNKNIELPIKNNQPDYKTMETLISAIKKLIIKDVVDYMNKKIVLYYLVLIFLYYSNNNSILIYK